MVVKSCLGQSDNEMVKFSILVEMGRLSKTAVFTSEEQNLNCLGHWLREPIGSQS